MFEISNSLAEYGQLYFKIGATPSYNAIVKLVKLLCKINM